MVVLTFSSLMPRSQGRTATLRRQAIVPRIARRTSSSRTCQQRGAWILRLTEDFVERLVPVVVPGRTRMLGSMPVAMAVLEAME
jgi:hypothetical protein